MQNELQKMEYARIIEIRDWFESQSGVGYSMPWYKIPLWRWRSFDFTSHYRERDMQRKKAYKAENMFLMLRHQLAGPERAFDWIEGDNEIRDYVMNLSRSAWFQERFSHSNPQRNITVTERPRGGADASYYSRVLRFSHSTNMRTRLVVLHELAHLATPPTTGGAHGRYWARAYLELVGHECGSFAMRTLRSYMATTKVHFEPKPFGRDMNFPRRRLPLKAAKLIQE